MYKPKNNYQEESPLASPICKLPKDNGTTCSAAPTVRVSSGLFIFCTDHNYSFTLMWKLSNVWLSVLMAVEVIQTTLIHNQSAGTVVKWVRTYEIVYSKYSYSIYIFVV